MMNAVPRRLPIELVLKRSFLYAWESRAVLITPLVVYAVIIMLAGLIVTGQSNAIKFVLAAAEQVFGVGFAVGIHRFVLAGEARAGIAFFHWDRHFVRYLLLTLLLMLLAAVAGIMVLGIAVDPAAQAVRGGPIVGLFCTAALFTVLVVITRLSLLLPAAALGAEVPARTIWQATQGNGFRLLVTMLLAALPFFVVEATLLGIGGGDQPSVIGTILASLVTAAQLVVITITMALSYDVLVRGGGPPARS
jgi:hypothetical protein